MVAVVAQAQDHSQCGRHNNQGRKKIVGGTDADKNEFPWQVRLSYQFNATFILQCGGSILTADTILTAAHCTEGIKVKDMTVYVADHNQNRDDGEISHEVCHKTEHPEYNTVKSSFVIKHDKDIAILHLCKPLVFTQTVGPICLPEPGVDYEHRKALVTGWGHVNSTTRRYYDRLQKATVTTITNKECKKAPKYENRITDFMLCAEGAGKDTCQGDSGGPLVVRGDGRFTQVGIVSWGQGCAVSGYPGIYTRLTSLLGWINKTNKLTFSSPSSTQPSPSRPSPSRPSPSEPSPLRPSPSRPSPSRPSTPRPSRVSSAYYIPRKATIKVGDDGANGVDAGLKICGTISGNLSHCCDTVPLERQFTDDWFSGSTEVWDEAWFGNCFSTTFNLCKPLDVTIWKNPEVKDSLKVHNITLELIKAGERNSKTEFVCYDYNLGANAREVKRQCQARDPTSFDC